MSIALRGVSKKFPVKQSSASLPVLDGIDLTIADGSVTALFGPNGCGKTTILNVIAGIESHDSGSVEVNGDRTDGPLVGYSFQNFHEVLLPWKSALDNVAFALLATGTPRATAVERSRSFVDAHGFAFPRENYPYQLSLGQQQTVALARTLIHSPSNVLLDEPFAALDHEARFRMQDVVISVLSEKPTAVVFISHDVDEALYMSDELLLLSKRPARVIQRFPVPFERPRRHDLLASAEFATLRREVIAAFLKEVGA